MAEFLMPSLGADMSAGTLVCFRKRPGELVTRGDILAEVETDKGLIEIECFQNGRLDKLLVEPGSKVPVGTPLASIVEERGAHADVDGSAAEAPARGTQVSASAPAPLPSPAATEQRAAPARAREPVSVAQQATGVPALQLATLHATPAARRLLRERGLDVASVHAADPHGTLTAYDLIREAARAAEPATERRKAASPRARQLAQAHGVSLEPLAGSGPGGYVVAADVEAATREGAPAARAPSPGAPDAPAALDARARMRLAIAEATSRSKREIPHFYLAQTLPLSTAMAWLERQNEGRPIGARVLPVSLFVRAVVAAVRKVPELNGTYEQGRLRESAEVHVTMAISLRSGGLVAPSLRNAEQRSLDQLSQDLAELVESARGGRLRSSQMAAGTIGITSLGDRGVETVFPVIMPPQVAMVGFGAIAPAPCVVDGAVIACPAVVVTLAADHRVCDGHRGGIFLRALARALQEVPA